jgi:hypothetical protein
MILLLNLIELLIISSSLFFTINLVFFNSTSSAKAKFLSARIRVLLVCRPIILKEAEINNIKQESYINCSILSFSR